MTNTQKNDVTALREILFEELRTLKGNATADDLARAKAKSELAQTIINSVKVEIDAVKVIGGQGSGFIPAPEHPVSGKPAVRTTRTGTITQIGGVTQHKAS